MTAPDTTMKDGGLGIAIGEIFEAICQHLETNNADAKQRITEFTAGVSFLIRQNVPFLVILLYLAEYREKSNSE